MANWWYGSEATTPVWCRSAPPTRTWPAQQRVFIPPIGSSQATTAHAVHVVTRRLGPVNTQGLSLRRARSTWLSAHLVAGTPLASLRRVAGPLSSNTLDGLLGYANASTDDMTAVTGALGA